MSDIAPWEEARRRLMGKRGQTRHLQSEEELAREGGAKQINSGRTWHSKRDVTKFDFLFENRQTDGKTITIKGEELTKIGRDAVFEHKLPAMRLDFSQYNEDWVLTRRRDFEQREERLLQLEGLLADAQKSSS